MLGRHALLVLCLLSSVVRAEIISEATRVVHFDAVGNYAPADFSFTTPRLTGPSVPNQRLEITPTQDVAGFPFRLAAVDADSTFGTIISLCQGVFVSPPYGKAGDIVIFVVTLGRYETAGLFTDALFNRYITDGNAHLHALASDGWVQVTGGKVPAPASFGLVGLGLAALLWRRWTL